jgi:hypothetical protein
LNTVKDAGPAGNKAPTAAAKGKTKPDEVDHELDGLMSEIESDLREDELKRIWRDYGTIILTFVVALLLGVVGVQLYQRYETQQREAAGLRYETAIKLQEDKKTDEALAAYADIAKTAPRGYATMARLSQAAIQVEKGDIDGALANYKLISADGKVDQVFRDLATLLFVLHSLDRADPKTLEAQLTPLTSPNNAFNPSALELTALLAAKQGDTARAIKTLSQLLGDPSTTQSMRSRAEDLTKLYEAGALPAPPAIPATTPPPAAPTAPSAPPAAAVPAAPAAAPSAPAAAAPKP